MACIGLLEKPIRRKESGTKELNIATCGTCQATPAWTWTSAWWGTPAYTAPATT